jgi:hypothetical protein
MARFGKHAGRGLVNASGKRVPTSQHPKMWQKTAEDGFGKSSEVVFGK